MDNGLVTTPEGCVMDNASESTIAALFYSAKPALSFARLVGELHRSLEDSPHDRLHQTWDMDDVAIFDMDASRIMVAYAEGLDGPHPEALAVSVGPGPGAVFADRLSGRRDAICRLIIQRIEEHYPADTTIWHRDSGVMTTDRLDDLVEMLAREAGTIARATMDEPAPAAAGPAPAPQRVAGRGRTATPRPKPVTAPSAAEVEVERQVSSVERSERARRAAALGAGAVDRLLARMEAELAREPTTPPRRPRVAPRRATQGKMSARHAMRPDKVQGRVEPANATPDLPHPLLQETARVRAALYPEPPKPQAAPAEQETTAMRLAVGSMSATLVIVALPVGAALLTYNALGGANFKVTARAMALTGAVLGVTQMPAVQAILSVI
jgi:hypothetical protein